jgi:hypothetical protein
LENIFCVIFFSILVVNLFLNEVQVVLGGDPCENSWVLVLSTWLHSPRNDSSQVLGTVGISTGQWTAGVTVARSKIGGLSQTSDAKHSFVNIVDTRVGLCAFILVNNCKSDLLKNVWNNSGGSSISPSVTPSRVDTLTNGRFVLSCKPECLNTIVQFQRFSESNDSTIVGKCISVKVGVVIESGNRSNLLSRLVNLHVAGSSNNRQLTDGLTLNAMSCGYDLGWADDSTTTGVILSAEDGVNLHGDLIRKFARGSIGSSCDLSVIRFKGSIISDKSRSGLVWGWESYSYSNNGEEYGDLHFR